MTVVSLLLSGRSRALLEGGRRQLAAYCLERPGLDPQSVAATLAHGRVPFEFRSVRIVPDGTSTSVAEMLAAADELAPKVRVVEGHAPRAQRTVAVIVHDRALAERALPRLVEYGLPRSESGDEEDAVELHIGAAAPPDAGSGVALLASDEFALQVAAAELWCRGIDIHPVSRAPRVHLPARSFRAADEDGELSAEPTAKTQGRPLTGREQRLVFHDAVRSGSSSAEHSVTAVCPLPVNTDLAQLDQAWCALQEQQSLLRRYFTRSGDQWLALEADRPLTRLETSADHDSPVAFDITDGPLVRLHTAGSGTGRTLTLTLYQAIADSISPEHLLGELLGVSTSSISTNDSSE